MFGQGLVLFVPTYSAGWDFACFVKFRCILFRWHAENNVLHRIISICHSFEQCGVHLLCKLVMVRWCIGAVVDWSGWWLWWQWWCFCHAVSSWLLEEMVVSGGALKLLMDRGGLRIPGQWMTMTMPMTLMLMTTMTTLATMLLQMVNWLWVVECLGFNFDGRGKPTKPLSGVPWS